ncbi:MAG: phosphatase family protein [Ramlibacter sp.]|nr:phosphatase family protein [Ramlibacter sp.]
MKQLAVAVVALALFALLLHEVLAQGVLTRFDSEVLLYFAAHRSGWLTSLALATSTLHQTVAVLAATALAAAVLAWRRRARWALLLLAVPTGMLANNAIKHLVQRDRPTLDAPLVQLTTLSFPSGHAIAATLFYGALLLVLLAHQRRWPVRLAAAAFATAMILLVAFARIYLGVHYLSDVLAAICLGVAWLALWLAGLERWERRRYR